MSEPSENEVRLARARVALEGLALGDAFGERFFGPAAHARQQIEQRMLPAAPWRWTDDTAMALAVFETLRQCGEIDRDVLAQSFVQGYLRDVRRGYGAGAHDILQAISRGLSWDVAAGAAFGGQGSMGNGSAMRVAPVGAYFAGDLSAVVEHAARSADPTHAHEDARAGAIAVALAAALAWEHGSQAQTARGAIWDAILARTPAGPTRDGIVTARGLGFDSSVDVAVRTLGNGSRVICQDTVPFSLWCALRHLDDFEEAMWITVAGLGDRDTTCAIVGGIVALSSRARGLPDHFLAAREPLSWPIPSRA